MKEEKWYEKNRNDSHSHNIKKLLIDCTAIEKLHGIRSTGSAYPVQFYLLTIHLRHRKLLICYALLFGTILFR